MDEMKPSEKAERLIPYRLIERFNKKKREGPTRGQKEKKT